LLLLPKQNYIKHSDKTSRNNKINLYFSRLLFKTNNFLKQLLLIKIVD